MRGNAANLHTVLFFLLMFFLIISCIIISGCLEGEGNNLESSGCGFERIIQITEPGQIKESVQKGPILLMAGSSKDPEYMAQASVLGELSEKYEGISTVACIDSDQDPDFSKRFLGVGNKKKLVSCIILNIEHGTYLYMQENGEITPEYAQASFSGYTEKEVLERALDHAVRYRERAFLKEFEKLRNETSE